MRLLIGIAFLVSACLASNEYVRPKPEKLIEQKKFTKILGELMLVESHIQTQMPQLDLSFKSVKRSSQHIFQKYRVRSDDFDRSFEYYASDKPIMKEIYNEILEDYSYKMNRLQPRIQ